MVLYFGCTSLVSVHLGNNVASIGPGAFDACRALTSVNLPDSLITIGDGAFHECSITNLLIPNGVTAIGSGAFSTTGQRVISIPRSVTQIGAYPFLSDDLLAIDVDPLNRFYSSLDGVLFDEYRRTLIQCPGGRSGGYTIPDSVTRIAYGAFSSCSWLSWVAIPASVEWRSNGSVCGVEENLSSKCDDG